MLHLIALTAWMAVGAPAAQTPEPGSVTGVVVHAATGAPLADVRVTLADTGQQARTDATGRFVIAAVRPGAATVTVSNVGFLFVRRRVDVVPGGITDIVIPLAEGAGTYAESVSVTSDTTDEVRGDTRDLGPGVLQELRGVAADDPVRAVQALPGVATGDDFQAEFSARGAAFRHTGMVVDGVATPLLFHAVRGAGDTGSIAMINTDVLGRASLSIGPSPLRHGTWLGPTLTLDIREGSRTRPGVRGAVSGTSASAVLEGPLGRRGSWIASIRKSYVDWLVRKIEPDIDSTIGFTDTQHKVVWDLGARTQLQLTMLGGRAVYQKPQATSANDIRRAVSSSGMASLAVRTTTDRALFLTRVSIVGNDFRNTGLKLQEQARGHQRSWIIRSDTTVPVRRWTLEAGVSREQQQDAQTLNDWVTQSNGSLRLRGQQSVESSRSIAEAYGQASGRWAGLGLSSGVRVSVESRLHAREASPWLLVERKVGPIVLSASTARLVQFTPIDDIAPGGTSLVPERARLADVGAQADLTGSLRWRVNGFVRRDRHLLRPLSEDAVVNGTRVVASRFPFYRSSLDGRTRGVDVVLERRAPTGPTGWVGYTWAHTRQTDEVSGEAFDGDFDQRHTLNLFFQQRLSYRLMTHLKYRYGSNFPVTGYFAGTVPDAMVLASTRNALRLPAYSRLDLNLNRTFTFTRARMTLFVEVVNAVGRRNFGMADGSVRSNLSAVGWVERLLPRIPSAGLLVEF